MVRRAIVPPRSIGAQAASAGKGALALQFVRLFLTGLALASRLITGLFP